MTPRKQKFEDLRIEDNGEVRIYRCLKMPAHQAIRYSARVLKCLAPIAKSNTDLLANIIGSSELENSTDQQLNFKLVEFLSGAIESINIDHLIDLAEEALKDNFFAGKGEDMKKLSEKRYFNEWFDDYPQDVLKVYAFAIATNSKSFLNLQELF